jgi:hypothetical protein
MDGTRENHHQITPGGIPKLLATLLGVVVISGLITPCRSDPDPDRPLSPLEYQHYSPADFTCGHPVSVIQMYTSEGNKPHVKISDDRRNYIGCHPRRKTCWGAYAYWNQEMPSSEGTGKYIRWPPNPIPRRCAYILDTNVLLEAQCTLPASCGQPRWIIQHVTWWGREVGLCIGAGTIREGANLEERGWVEIQKLTPDPSMDACGVSPLLFLVQFKNGSKVVAPRTLLSNTAIYHAAAGSLEISIPQVTAHISQKPCPAVSAHQWTRPFNRPEDVPFLATRTLSSAIPFRSSRLTWARDILPTANGSIMGVAQVVSEDGLPLYVLGQVLSRDVPEYACLNEDYRKEYSLHWLNSVEHVLENIFRAIFTLLGEALIELRHVIIETYHTLDEQYYLTESAVVFLLATWRLDRWISVAAVTLCYLWVTGFTRNH